MTCYVPKYDIYLCNTHLSCGFHLFNRYDELNTYISSIKELLALLRKDVFLYSRFFEELINLFYYYNI